MFWNAWGLINKLFVYSNKHQTTKALSKENPHIVKIMSKITNRLVKFIKKHIFTSLFTFF